MAPPDSACAASPGGIGAAAMGEIGDREPDGGNRLVELVEGLFERGFVHH